MLQTRRGHSSHGLETLEPRQLLSASLAPTSITAARLDPPHVIPAAILAPEPSNTSDFDGDGENDLVFRARGFGNIGYLELDDDGTASDGAFTLPRLSDPNWDLAGAADFDGDGDPDLLFRNLDNHRNVVWIMDGADRESAVALPQAPAAWRVVGVGDFDGDGTADIYWQNDTDRRTTIWTLDDGAIDTTFAGPRVTAGWSAAGVGDFDDDGDSDVLLRKASTGQNAIWYFNDENFVSGSAAFAPLRDDAWHVGDVKDFDGDGDADIAWRNVVTNQNAIWFMDDDGTTRVSVATIPGFANRQWELPGQVNAEFIPAGSLAAIAHHLRGDAGDAEDDAGLASVDTLVDVEPLVTFATL